MAARIIGEAGDILAEPRGRALQHLVGLVAAPEDDLVRVLQVPPHAALGAVDAHGEVALPSGGHLRDRGVGVDAFRETMRRIAEVQQQAPEILGVHSVRHHRRRIALREGLHLARRTVPRRVEGPEVSEHALRLGAEDERHRVDPMGADVADRAELAALAGEQAPVVVGVLEQPVLEEVALHMDDPPEIAALDQRAHLQHRGEEAAHVVHGEDRAARARLAHRRDDLGRLLRGHAQRLLADHVLAGLERVERLLDVDLVGRGDVDDVHVRRSDHRAVVVIAVDRGDPPPVRRGAGRPGGTADGGDLHAEALEPFDVDRADETGADDPGTERVERLGHARSLDIGDVRTQRETRAGALPGSALRADGKLRSARGGPDPRKRLSRPLTKGREVTIFRPANRPGSSMAEQLTLNQFVVGSSPARGTSFPGVLQRCRPPFSCR